MEEFRGTSLTTARPLKDLGDGTGQHPLLLARRLIGESPPRAQGDPETQHPLRQRTCLRIPLPKQHCWSHSLCLDPQCSVPSGPEISFIYV